MVWKYEKNLNHVHPFVTAFIGKIKKINFGGEAILPTKKRLCTKFEQGKFEILWYSYFCLKFFRAFNWIPIVNIFLNLILIHSQISCIFAITDFPPLSQCDAIWRGVDIKVRGGESIWCLFAGYDCHLILTHEMKKLPQLKYWTTRKMSFQRINTFWFHDQRLEHFSWPFHIWGCESVVKWGGGVFCLLLKLGPTWPTLTSRPTLQKRSTTHLAGRGLS